MPRPQVPKDVERASLTDMSNIVEDITTTDKDTDGLSDQKETTWQNSDWPLYFGQYSQVPEVRIALLTRAIWCVKDWDSEDKDAKAVLEGITGSGNQTFTTILRNMIIIKRLNGDSYAEIIKNSKGELRNLKCLNPGSIRIHYNRQGRITKYVQTTRTGGKKGEKVFQPEDILHFSNEKPADSLHGISDLESLQSIIQALKESFDDFKTVVHRNVVPLRVIEADTDNPTKIAKIREDFENLVNKKEFIVVPKGSVVVNPGGLAGNATFNPLPWRESLRDYFWEVVSIPKIIVGNAKEFSESAAKVAYLSFQQSIEEEQRYVEEMIENQLLIQITLSFPATIQNELISDEKKDQGQALNTQPSEMTVGPESGT